MTKSKTSSLEGPALDWAVAKCEKDTGAVGQGAVKTFLEYRVRYGQWLYSTDWSQGGPIIEREGIELGLAKEFDKWYASMWCPIIQFGPTPLIAAMRCYVASKLGNEIDIPDELYR